MPSADIDTLLKRAADLMAARRFAEADPVLSAAYALVPATDHARAETIARALAAARMSLGRATDAITTFRRYAQHHEPPCDPQFDEIYDAGLAVTGTFAFPARRRLRFYSLIEEFDAALPLTGRIAECGCFRGLSSYLMNRYLQLYDDTHDGDGYDIFDSFQGLSEPGEADAIPADWPAASQLANMTRRGAFDVSQAAVRRHLSAFPAITFHPGWIPASFMDLPEATYRFVHVDVDLYDPTLACLDYFTPRLVAGGSIVCDDYNWPGARLAVEQHAASQGLDLRITEHEQAVLSRCS